MITLLAFIITIGVLVVIHEYGHFQVARWCGVKVLEFSVGFGQPLWQKTFGRDKTNLKVAAIPLGGYVKMLDERELDSEEALAAIPTEDLPRAFNRKPVLQRIAIVLAGPVANLILAIFLYWILMMMGQMAMKPIVGDVAPDSIAARAGLHKGDVIQSIDEQPVTTWRGAHWVLLEQSVSTQPIELVVLKPDGVLHQSTMHLEQVDQGDEIDVLKKLGLSTYQPTMRPVVGVVTEASAAAKAGLKVGDRIVRIDEMAIDNWEQLVTYVKARPNQLLSIEIQRNAERKIFEVIPEAVKLDGKDVGRIGVGVQMDKAMQSKLLTEVKYPPYHALLKAIEKTWDTSIFSLKMLWSMVTGKTSWKAISGPGTIASFAGESASLGIKPFLNFLALVSISIGILNLLPIPMLDGGHLMYYIVEIIKGSPVSESVMLVGQKIGIALLGMLMMVAILNDISRFLA